MADELTLAAYVDGELSPDAVARLEAEMARDPALAAEVERLASVRTRLAQAYGPVLQEPVPPELVALASAANDRGPSRIRLWQAAAMMAATLLVGVVIGRQAWPQQGSIASRGDLVVAQGGLKRALETKLASEAGATRVGLTFRGPRGAWCRTFQEERRSGVACRRETRWVIEGLAPAAPAQAQAYRTAGSEMSPVVLGMVEQLRVGDAVDAQQERAARDGGWRP